MDEIKSIYLGERDSSLVLDIREFREWLTAKKREEHERLLQQRRRLASRLSSGRRKAYARASACAGKKAHQELLRSLQTVEQFHQERMAQVEHECIDLACTLSEQFVGKAIREHAPIVAQQVSAALKVVRERHACTVFLHPEDHQRVRDLFPELRFGNDPLLAHGCIRVETAIGTINFDWRDRLDSMREMLHQKLRSSRSECYV